MFLFNPSNLDSVRKYFQIHIDDLPICGRWHIAYFLQRHILRHKCFHRMTDEEVCMLNALPQPVPSLGLWGTWSCHQITSNLDMAPVNNRSFWCKLLCDGDQSWHLWVINDNDICT